MTKFAAKTASNTGLHMLMASVAAFVLTGNFATSLAVALLEATLMSLAHPLHDWVWQRVPALLKASPKSATPAENVHFV